MISRRAIARPSPTCALLLSAGAPVPSSVLRAVAEIMPNAEAHTPYGMTEVLPVSDITPAGIEAAGAGNGVCVGRPLAEVSVAISPLDDAGQRDGRVDDASRASRAKSASGPRT